MNWSSHKHIHKLAYHWQTREEVPAEVKADLNNRMALNYYGFWGNKLAHLYIFSAVFRKYVMPTTVEFVYWGKTLGLIGFLWFTATQTDKLLRNQLISVVQDLHTQHWARIDRLQQDYLDHREEYEHVKGEKLDDLAARGKNVKMIKRQQ